MTCLLAEVSRQEPPLSMRDFRLDSFRTWRAPMLLAAPHMLIDRIVRGRAFSARYQIGANRGHRTVGPGGALTGAVA